MSLRNLVDAQCGERNSLLNLSYHFTHDKAQTDAGIRRPFRGDEFQQAAGDGAVEQLVQEFMNETQQAIAPMAHFRMDALLQEMREIESSRGPPLLGPAVAELASAAQSSGDWASEFLENEAHIVQANSNLVQEMNDYQSMGSDDMMKALPQAAPHHPNGPVHPLHNDFTFNYPPSLPFQGMNRFPPPGPVMPLFHADPHTAINAPHHLDAVNGTTQEDSELARTANELLGTVDDPLFSNTKFMQFMHKLGEGATEEQVNAEKKENQEQPSVRAKQPNSAAQSSEESLGVKEENLSVKNDVLEVDVDSSKIPPGEREDYWDSMQRQWEERMAAQDDTPSWLTYEENFFDEPFKPYVFTKDNSLVSHPDALAEGERCLAAGDIPSAVLLFEAAAQQEKDCVKAWYLLGRTHAENEQDYKAIPALRRCVELDKNHSDAWMELATSYTNEVYQTQACQALKEWLRSKSDYKDLFPNDVDTSHSRYLPAALAPSELVSEVQAELLKAANHSQSIDPGVQCGLGVLLNLTGNYDKAIDCFEAAIKAEPKDSRLWNKLGATLANSNRSAKAVAAYQTALELSPGFIRCRYNLGIACINLNSYKEALEQFLCALNMQAAGRGLPQSTSKAAVSDCIWSTLRMCLPHLKRTDLIAAVENKDLKTINAAFKGTSSD